MGNCNCIDERSDQEVPLSDFAPAATLRPRFAAGRHHLSDLSATSFDLPPPHSVQDIVVLEGTVEEGRRGNRGMVEALPAANNEVEWELGSEGREDLVRRVQGAIRIALEKKKLKAKERECIEESDPAGVQPELSSETLKDPYSLLSYEAGLTLNSLGPFHYPYSLRRVSYYEPRLLPDNSIYVGQWRNSGLGMYRKGKGKLFRTDGSYCEGYWNGKEMEPLGRVVNADGDWYEGEMKAGERSGNGSFRSFDRRTEYTGQWLHSLKHGSGSELTSDGSSYSGDYVNGERSGFGTLRMSNGKIYTGHFLAGQFDGKGKHIWPDGRIYEGDWKAGEMHGRGYFQYTDGKIYEGDYFHEKKHGKGTYRWDGKVYEGDWMDGAMHGVGYLTTQKGRHKYEFQKGQRGREIPD